MALAWLVAVALACGAYGLGAARLLRLGFGTRLERLTVAFAFGAGLLSTAVMTLGFAGLLGSLSSALVVLPAAAAGLWWLLRPRLPAAEPARPRWLRITLCALLGTCAVANLFGALAPPASADALTYHLLAPRLYLQAGAIREIPWDWHTYQPFGVEMLFTLGMSLSGPPLAALLHAALGLLAAAGAALLGRRFAGPTGGLLAAAVFYCTAIVAWESTSCYIELGIAAFGTLSVHALLRWDEGAGRGWLAAAGLLGGFAAACKLTGALLPLLVAVLLVYRSAQKRRPAGATLRALLAFGAIALVPVLPWYVRNAVWTGNPVYPFLPGVFGDNPVSAAVWEILDSYGTERGLVDLLVSPWRLATEGDRFDRGQALGALPLLLAPVLVWRAVRARELRGVLLVCVLFFGAWFFGSQQARFLLPFQPLLAALAAEALTWLAGAGRLQRVAAALAAGPALGVGVAATLAYDAQFGPVVLAFESEHAYLERKSGYYTVFRDVTRQVPPEGRILVGMGGTFYLGRPHAHLHAADLQGGPERLWRALSTGGFTHLLVEGPEQEAAAMALGSRVRRCWTRTIELPVSRTLGGIRSVTVSLYGVGRTACPRVTIDSARADPL